MDTERLSPAGSADLVAGARLERRHFDGMALEDVSLEEVELHDCMFSDCTGGTCAFPGLQSSSVHLIGCDIATLDLRGSRIFGGKLEGVRVGALLVDRADLSVTTVRDSRIDVLSITDGRSRRIDLIDCEIGLLDFSGSRLREVTVTGGHVGELVPSRGRIDAFDISRTVVASLRDAGALAGATISAAQAVDFAADLARAAGATVVD